MNPKAKGSAYERNVCKRLSLWITGMTRKDVLWRSAMSGGRATVGRRKGEHHETAGDICATDPLGHALTGLFVIECKHYRDFGLDGYFFGCNTKITEFWNKVLEECQGRRSPLLIANQNRRQELVFTNSEGLRILRTGGTVRPLVHIPARDMYCITLTDMLMLNFSQIRQIHQLRAIRKELE